MLIRILTGIVAIPLLAGSVRAETAQRALEAASRIEFKITQANDLEKLEAERVDIRSTRPERRPVSDMLLELTTPGADVHAALLAPNGQAAGNGSVRLRARLLTVIGGRIYKDGVASCSAFESEIAVCTVDCDAGRFGLRRSRGGSGDSLKVLIGALPREIEAGAREGFAVTPCGLDDTGEVRVVPKAGRGLVEIGFTGDATVD